MIEELLEAKKRLYCLLLGIPEDNITDNELEIMSLLAQDEQIQNYLNTKK